MSKAIKNIVVLGGGSAGWLTAGIIAGEHRENVRVTLVESPDVATIGVGEGTWPSMRDTLRKIGVSESAFIRECDVSFKQGSKFIGWQTGHGQEFYYHPFSPPQGILEVNSIPYWQRRMSGTSFASAVSAQESLCEARLAPKQSTTPDYAAVVNYAYHLDAAKFGLFLREHCTAALGVKHISDHVIRVRSDADDFIQSLVTRNHGDLEGDLFIDCSGGASMLVGEHFKQPLVSRRDVLFNDRALAVQIPYRSQSDPIASATLATACSAGWIWDIGLPTRRGVGYVYSSAHITDECAEAELLEYLRPALDLDELGKLQPRRLRFEPGMRESFWRRNCVAVGMSAGFIEPLEASALAMVELSAAMIRDDLPADRSTMHIVAARFNRRFRYRWDRVIEFLKLHYLLSRREDTDYWRDHREPSSVPERLQELMALWRHRPPSRLDFEQSEEIFSYASYQYVLYGMDHVTRTPDFPRRSEDPRAALRVLEENNRHTRKLLKGLPSNRELLSRLNVPVAAPSATAGRA